MNFKLFSIWLLSVFLIINISNKVFAYNLSGTRWPGLTATYYSVGGGSNSIFDNAFVEAMNNWDLLSKFVFTNTSGYKDPCWDPNNNPGGPWFNGWEFRNDLCGTSLGGSVLAVNIRWSIGSTIVQAGTVFNSAFTWDIHNGYGFNNDFRRVATHELGHALGLSHDNTFSALMNSTYSQSIEIPQTDDINGLRAIYGICNYSLSSMSKTLLSGGGTGSVNVSTSSGCPWTATSNASWITITSGSSGNGNGTVNYSVSLNSSTSQRTGSMTIAGQTYSITQNGRLITVTTDDIDGSGQDDIIVDFGPDTGTYVRLNNSTLLQLHTLSPIILATGDIDGGGKDEIIIDFGTPSGIWIRMNNSTWVHLHTLSPETMTTGDIDGSGQDDIIVDFGDLGTWVRMNNSTWVQLHTLSALTMTTGDIDGGGKDEVIIDFGTPSGVWIRMNNSTWSALPTP